VVCWAVLQHLPEESLFDGRFQGHTLQVCRTAISPVIIFDAVGGHRSASAER
jgi:hypothetical protein